MPHSPVAAPDRGVLLASARARWDAVGAARPDLAPAIELQRRLLTLVIDLTDEIRRGRVPRLSLPPKYVAAKLARGIPAFAGEPIPLPVASLTRPLLQVCDELAAGGAREPAEHVRAAIDGGSIDPGALLAASLARDQHAIRSGSVHRGLAPDLVWLVAELVVSPFAHALQQSLFGPADAGSPLGDALAAWSHGYCAACGSWPALAEVVNGRRLLRCSFCATAWELPTYACVYCGEAGEPFVTAAPNQERADRRVEVCGSCSGYLKAVEVPEPSSFPLLAIADLETMDLDVAAMEHGYARPPLKEFGRAKAKG
ncbi:MAG: formate dehydrogenase accessory protein FdhE [Betaproteobacteria bacterium]